MISLPKSNTVCHGGCVSVVTSRPSTAIRTDLIASSTCRSIDCFEETRPRKRDRNTICPDISEDVNRIDVDPRIDAVPLAPDHDGLDCPAQGDALWRSQQDLIAVHPFNSRKRRWRWSLHARSGEAGDRPFEHSPDL